MTEPSLNLDLILRITEIGSIIGGVLIGAFKLGSVTKRFELVATNQSREIGELKVEVHELGKITTLMAEQTGRINLTDERVLAQGKRLDELIDELKELRKNGSRHERGSLP